MTRCGDQRRAHPRRVLSGERPRHRERSLAGRNYRESLVLGKQGSRVEQRSREQAARVAVAKDRVENYAGIGAEPMDGRTAGSQ